MKGDPVFLTISEAADLIKKKELSPVDLTKMLFEKVAAVNPKLNAFITVTMDRALEQARRAENEISAGHYKGPMHGIPFGLKDIYNTAGIRTTGHSKVTMDNVPAEDATTVAKLFEAGAVLMGKLATHEYAHGGPSFDLPWPPARNPWNPDHFTGGSSSGSAASVAAGLVLGALGSDTGGSIRTPSSLCGIVGLKPTYGLVSRYGVMPNSFTFDYCGPMTWTVEDCAIMLQTLAGYDDKDPTSSRRTIPDYRRALTPDIRGMRIGVARHFWEKDLKISEDGVRAMEAAIDVFTQLGAKIEEVRLQHPQVYHDVKIVIAESELFAVHHQNLINRPGDFGTDFLARVLPACLFSAIDYVQAQRKRRQLIEEMQPIYGRYDVLLTPGNGPAPRYDAYQSEVFRKKASVTTVFNVTGGPALVMCNGFNPKGLPLSMQIVGKPFDESSVFKAAYAYEQATPWRKRRPEIPESVQPLKRGPAPPDVAIEPKIQSFVETAAKAVGLKLNDAQFKLLCAGAVPAMEMAASVRSEFSQEKEPANIFCFPNL